MDFWFHKNGCDHKPQQHKLLLASIYRGVTRISNHQSNPNLGSIWHSFPREFLFAWATTYFVRDISAYVDKSYSRPIIWIYGGTLNALQFWEKNVVDCWDLICGRLMSMTFTRIHFPHRLILMYVWMTYRGLWILQNSW